MRIIIITLFALCVVAATNAQEVTLTLRDSTIKEGKIVATMATAVYVNSTRIDFKDIAKANFKADRPADRDLQQNMVNAGIKVSINGTKKEIAPVVVQSPLVQEQADPIKIDLPTMNDRSMQKFLSTRNTGKVVQLLGVGALTYVSLIALKNSVAVKENRLKDVKEIPPFLPVGGFGLIAVGLFIDIGASSHLQR